MCHGEMPSLPEMPTAQTFIKGIFHLINKVIAISADVLQTPPWANIEWPVRLTFNIVIFSMFCKGGHHGLRIMPFSALIFLQWQSNQDLHHFFKGIGAS